jgi:hypothetical protein
MFHPAVVHGCEPRVRRCRTVDRDDPVAALRWPAGDLAGAPSAEIGAYDCLPLIRNFLVENDGQEIRLVGNGSIGSAIEGDGDTILCCDAQQLESLPLRSLEKRYERVRLERDWIVHVVVLPVLRSPITEPCALQESAHSLAGSGDIRENRGPGRGRLPPAPPQRQRAQARAMMG